MKIEEQLTARLKDAMRAKKTDEISVIRMVKSMATKERTAAGFNGEIDDDFWLKVIGKYVKQQKKALVEFENLGDTDSQQVATFKFEIEYLKPFLPSLLDEATVTILVEEAIAATGASGAKMTGKVIGAVMRTHKDDVDPAMVKRIAAHKLG